MSDLPPVSAIADVLALRGLEGWLTPPLRPVVAAPAPIAGRAVTVALRAEPGGRGLGELQQLLSSPLDGAVVVVANAHGVGGAVWGEILSRAAKASGAAAVLVDGAVRDRVAMEVEGLPVYATTEAVVGPAGRVSVQALEVAVRVGDATVEPGDLVVVDAGGAVSVSTEHRDHLLDDARTYADAEARVLDLLAAGRPLTDAYVAKREGIDRILARPLGAP